MRKLIITLLLFSHFTFALAAQRPPSGEDVSQIRTVNLQAHSPAQCASVLTRKLTLHLSVGRLTEKAGFTSSHVGSESERLAAISAQRAQALLAKLTGPRDQDGCLTLKSKLDDEDLYLVLDEVEDGAVFAKITDSGQKIYRLEIRYLGTRCGSHCGMGIISIRLPNESANELDISWWTS